MTLQGSRTRNRRWLPWTIPALAMGLWFLVTPTPIRELTFPSPGSVWAAVLAIRSGLLTNAAATLTRVLLGWLMGASLGILVGLLMTASDPLERLLHPLLEFLRPLPTVALIPFFIIWFGIGEVGQVTLIGLAAFVVLVVNTFVAVHIVPDRYIRAASLLGASTTRTYRTVIVPAIVPSLVGGLRTSAAVAFAVGIAAEFLGAQTGLGYMIMVARRTLNTNTILLGVLIVAAESFLLDYGIRLLAQYFTRWLRDSRDALELLT